MNRQDAIERIVVVLMLIVFAVVIGLLLAMNGCAVQHPLPAATTRPVSNPISNINLVVYHSQKALEGINILAFVAALVGLGLAAFGLFEAQTALERLGLLIAAIAGAVALGTLAGIIALPFAPWVLLIGVAGGAGYGAYLLYEKHIVKKSAVVPLTPPSK